MPRWSFSLVLLGVYVAVFQGWTFLDRPWVIATGVLASATMLAWGLRRWRQGYFVNEWDAAAHASVILDIVLEAFLVRFHDGLGFYLCAAAFALVVGGYRARQFILTNPRPAPTT